MSEFVKIALPFVVGAALAVLTAILLVPYVDGIRGYSAVGGEWLLIVAVGFLGYKVSRMLFVRVNGGDEE